MNATEIRERFLIPAENEQAFLKCGIQGFSGAGKTRTASEIALGIHAFVQSKKPVVFIDTETGSDFVLKFFKAKKVDMLRQKARNRNFITLMGAIEEAAKLSDIIIVDSITHFWVDLVKSYMAKKGIERMAVHHWQPIKQEWQPFTDFMMGSKLHFINCGRAGWEFDRVEDEEGVAELTKTGTRMKAEGDMSFEPNLMIEMERVRAPEAIGKIGQSFINRMWIIKDRSDTINGRFFDLAKGTQEGSLKISDAFECILPHIKNLNIGGNHADVGRADSQALFGGPSSRSEEYKRREIFLEEIKQEMQLRFPGRSDADKQNVIRILRALYKTAAVPALEQTKADILETGLKRLREFAPDANVNDVVLILEAERSATNEAGK